MAMLPIPPVTTLDPSQRLKDSQVKPVRASGLDETVNIVGAAEEPQASEAQSPDREAVKAAVQEMQRSLPAMARNLQFSIDEQTGKTVVKVVDASTSELIRQFPSEELLNIAQALDKFSGLLIKQKI